MGAYLSGLLSQCSDKYVILQITPGKITVDVFKHEDSKFPTDNFELTFDESKFPTDDSKLTTNEPDRPDDSWVVIPPIDSFSFCLQLRKDEKGFLSIGNVRLPLPPLTDLLAMLGDRILKSSSSPILVLLYILNNAKIGPQ